MGLPGVRPCIRAECVSQKGRCPRCVPSSDAFLLPTEQEGGRAQTSAADPELSRRREGTGGAPRPPRGLPAKAPFPHRAHGLAPHPRHPPQSRTRGTVWTDGKRPTPSTAGLSTADGGGRARADAQPSRDFRPRPDPSTWLGHWAAPSSQRSEPARHAALTTSS